MVEVELAPAGADRPQRCVITEASHQDERRVVGGVGVPAVNLARPNVHHPMRSQFNGLEVDHVPTVAAGAVDDERSGDPEGMAAPLESAIALYIEGIAEGRPAEAVAAYTGDRYTQHSTGVKDGREGFIEFFTEFLERTPKREIEVVRGWDDGRYAFVHVHQRLNDGEAEWVTTDFFDTDESGKIVEHWDVISAYTGPGVSGRTQVDGPTEVTDLDRTEANKAVVRAMIENCLMTGATADRIDEFFADDYLQHNPEVADGLEPFKAFAHDPDRSLNYDEIVLLVGKGSFVATLCKASWDDRPLAQVDIFRLADDRIVEHWDNSEPVPEHSVNTGKF